MTGGRKIETYNYYYSGNVALDSIWTITHRNLSKVKLAGVIFGCTIHTMEECLQKQLFGLPESHISYVKNVSAGMPLFLFNYSNKKLHGVYEAISQGQMNIDPYAWTNGSQKTEFPAQVQVRVRLQCQPLEEDQFKPIISDNYYIYKHFWFELDRTQVTKLISLMSSSSSVDPSPSMLQQTACLNNRYAVLREEEDKPVQLPQRNVQFNCSAWKSNSVQTLFPSSVQNQTSENPTSERVLEEPDGEKAAISESELEEIDEKDPISESELEELDEKDPTSEIEFEEPNEKDLLLIELKDSLGEGPPDLPSDGHSQDPSTVHGTPDKEQGVARTYITLYEGNEDSLGISCGSDITIKKLILEVAELKTQRHEQALKMSHLEEKLVFAEAEIQRLKYLLCVSSSSQNAIAISDEQQVNKPILLVGGYNGLERLSSLDSYYPSCDMIKSLKPMSSVRSHASTAMLNGELYVLGGSDGYSTWYDSVESYNVAANTWKRQPSLNVKRGSLAGAVWDDKIFAMGGGNGIYCFPYVEMLDLEIGRWITTRSMMQKRFGLAAVELNGVIYACGGYDGSNYLSSTESHDLREYSWRRIPNMNSKRACHSLVVLNEKLYALGGYNGTNMVSSVEIYDPRLSSWMPGEPMSCARGYAAAVVLDQSIYVIGGVKDDTSVTSTVECYKEGQGWRAMGTSAVGKRCFMSAVVL